MEIENFIEQKATVRRLTRKQTTSRPDNVWQDMWKHMSDAAKSKAKQKWAVEKPKLDHARQLRGILFSAPEDEEFRHSNIRLLEDKIQD